ncbi:MAG: putative selenium-dependent hydroxylase accessory protein YqeC [Alphaproteobacteria bacterium]|nr:putative selenium-dependent hydroxylase accessory protein YqeC [Alphaproteobacteria bacterium]
MSIARDLTLAASRVIAVAGAGGKTSLIEALAREFAQSGEQVLATTTTKVGALEFTSGWHVVDEATEESLLSQKGTIPVFAYDTLTADGDKKTGLSCKLIDSVAREGDFSRILIEADGSKRRPLKMPAEHEPVIPASTDTLILVAGLRGLGEPLSEDIVFRSKLWSEMTRKPLGSIIEPDDFAAMARLYAKKTPLIHRRILFLNSAFSNQPKDIIDKIADLMKPEGFDVSACLLPIPLP